jgi:hypothetical protein
VKSLELGTLGAYVARGASGVVTSGEVSEMKGHKEMPKQR